MNEFSVRSGLLLVVVLLHFLDAAVVEYSLTAKYVPGNPDGFARPVIALFNTEEGLIPNRPFPGPLIRAKVGDELVVTLTNQLGEQRTSIHFHGLHMKNNPWMDGVVGITEPGIPAGQTYTYRFPVEQTGTYWYHSHAGMQYGDGFLGPLILDYANVTDDPVLRNYPYVSEYPIILQDWFHETTETLLLQYEGPYGAFTGYRPQYPWPTLALLLNGRGLFDCNFIENCSRIWSHNYLQCEDRPQCTPSRPSFFFGGCNESAHPIDEYMCTASRIRLRIINGASNIALRFWIDRHSLLVVARDGVEVQPSRHKYITLPVGQRLDVIVECSQNRSFSYKMFVSMTSAYIPDGATMPSPAIYSYALLTYASPAGPTIAPLVNVPADLQNQTVFNDTIMFEFNLPPLVPRTAPPADHRLIVTFHSGSDTQFGSPNEVWMLNGNTFMMPRIPILQAVTLTNNLNSVIVNEPGRDNNTLLTYIEHLEAGKVYEVIMVDIEVQQHPWHLHGYTVDFIGVGYLNRSSLAIGTDECNNTVFDDGRLSVFEHGLVPVLNESAPVIARGDSFSVPGYGYVIFRFTADNIGPWFFHCHVEWHLALGMAMVFSVESQGSYAGIVAAPSTFPVTGPPATWAVSYAALTTAPILYGATIGLAVSTGVLLLGLLSLIAIIVWWCRKQPNANTRATSA